ncbi:hypothetical protein PIB30_031699 [Stylosanthes scabra]|uniref:Uncharacterized protein n=1 Tax=Stylosanthes scabra TaxID=79078 RepID=A0ABU6RCK6_9FABA|nr:hypothetical protein [Stylosanthes scabra]
MGTCSLAKDVRWLVNHDTTAPTARPASSSPAFTFAPASVLDGGFPVLLQPPSRTVFPIFAARYTGTNSNLNKVDSNIPTSPDQKATTPMSEDRLTLEQRIRDNKQLKFDSVQDMSLDDPNKSNVSKEQAMWQRKFPYLCFLF